LEREGQAKDELESKLQAKRKQEGQARETEKLARQKRMNSHSYKQPPFRSERGGQGRERDNRIRETETKKEREAKESAHKPTDETIG
jgi:hypothetical protein